MKKKRTEKLQEKQVKRSRWVVAAAYCLLAWPAWWYCRGGSQGLFIMTCFLAGVAFLLPRAWPSVTRRVVWTWVVVTVVLFAANVERLMPPDTTGLYYEHVLDRLVTAFFAVGVSTLFFSLGTHAVTTLMLSVLPLLMLTLSRTEGTLGWLNGPWNFPLAGFVLFAVLLDQLAQLLHPIEQGERMVPFWREIRWRYVLLIGALAGGVLLRYPVEFGVTFVQKQILGMVTRSFRTNLANPDLSLSKPLPKRFDRKMRVVMLVQGQQVPGYLREVVYVTYQRGRWEAPKQGVPLTADLQAGGGGKETTYWLAKEQQGVAESNNLWRFEVLAPQLLHGLCLPGHARTLMCERRDFSISEHGMVTSETAPPDRYQIMVPERPFLARAYPLPLSPSNSLYCAIPTYLTNAVNQWMQTCDGLPQAVDAPQAARLLERHFHRMFTYRLDVNLRGYNDPLIQFMDKREGYCVHFASAAVLLLRAKGVPARVVAGYASVGYDVWLKRWVVRERERHAWVEFWDAAAGQWLMMDPTPPASRPSAYGSVDLFRHFIDVALTLWKRLIVSLRSANFLLRIAEAGIWCYEFVIHVLKTPLGWALLLVAGTVLWWRRRLRYLRLDPEVRERMRLREQIEKRVRLKVPPALRRGESESWDAWLVRLQGRIPEEDYRQLASEIETYQQIRYRVRMTKK